tara:strand:- start:117 stop:839 length:723 start_codon:yes stop_codon:yes gene_type:complete
MKNKFGFILVNPQMGENIGACARSLKNFNLSNLIIVNPKQGWPNIKTKATSVGAFDIIKKAKTYSSVRDSLNRFDVIFALSSRKRDINKKHVSFNDFIKIISNNRERNYGFMFGPEASGLSNEDLSFSNYILRIPTYKKFKSMNLSHSLTIICYEIFKLLNQTQFKKGKKLKKIASKRSLNKLSIFLQKLLEEKNFFKPTEKKKSMILNINNILSRLEISSKEIRILSSIFGSLSKNKKF